MIKYWTILHYLEYDKDINSIVYSKNNQINTGKKLEIKYISGSFVDFPKKVRKIEKLCLKWLYHNELKEEKVFWAGPAKLIIDWVVEGQIFIWASFVKFLNLSQ